MTEHYLSELKPTPHLHLYFSPTTNNTIPIHLTQHNNILLRSVAQPLASDRIVASTLPTCGVKLYYPSDPRSLNQVNLQDIRRAEQCFRDHCDHKIVPQCRASRNHRPPTSMVAFLPVDAHSRVIQVFRKSPPGIKAKARTKLPSSSGMVSYTKHFPLLLPRARRLKTGSHTG